ncbi:hypothetical protein ABIC86_001374 [Paenibacillus sp. DS2363]|nr:hypothetical protein [Paenibacillus xylanexedens]
MCSSFLLYDRYFHDDHGKLYIKWKNHIFKIIVGGKVLLTSFRHVRVVAFIWWRKSS